MAFIIGHIRTKAAERRGKAIGTFTFSICLNSKDTDRHATELN